jgi:outer membrane protein TolC
MHARLSENANIPTAPESIAVGIPADLLRRRPDVRRAERLAAAQSARIGIAVADFYPQISLAGSLGAQSEDLSRLFDFPGSMAASFGPSFRWPLLHYFRLANNVEVQEARFNALVLSYQESVLRAGREAEDSIYAFQQSHARTARVAESADAAEKALGIVIEQYREGAADYTSVYLLQSTVAQQQDQLAIARGSIALNLINTYRALGGGWGADPIGSDVHVSSP